MAATIQATIKNAVVNPDGKAVITVVLNDGKGEWEKTYKYDQTTPVDLTRFKETLTNDLRKDLGQKSILSNISPQVGKSFTITI